MTQKELGKRIGKAESSVLDMELGKRNVYLDEVCQIAEILSIHILIIPDKYLPNT